MRRISPAPRKKPAAFEYVGAAATAVAANAPNSPRRVNPEEFLSVMCFAPVPSLDLISSPYRDFVPTSPQMLRLYCIFRIVDQGLFRKFCLTSEKLAEFCADVALRILCHSRRLHRCNTWC